MPCSNAAKTRNPLKFGGVPQTTGPISAASGPKFTILWGMWRTYCCLTSFFPIVDICIRCEDIARQSCAMVPRWRFLATFYVLCFQRTACMQQVSDLHLKFALRPHHVYLEVWQTSNLRRLRLGEGKKKEERRRTNNRMKI